MVLAGKSAVPPLRDPGPTAEHPQCGFRCARLTVVGERTCSAESWSAGAEKAHGADLALDIGIPGGEVARPGCQHSPGQTVRWSARVLDSSGVLLGVWEQR